MLHLLCLAFSPAPRLSVGASHHPARAPSPVVALFGTPTKLEFADLDLQRCTSYLRTFPAKFRGWGAAEWKLFGLPPLSFSPRPIEGGVELVYYLSEAQAKQQGRGGVVEDGGECQRSALARPCTRPHPAPSASSLACARRTARAHRRCGRGRLLRPCAADRDPLDAGLVGPLSARGRARGPAQLPSNLPLPLTRTREPEPEPEPWLGLGLGLGSILARKRCMLDQAPSAPPLPPFGPAGSARGRVRQLEHLVRLALPEQLAPTQGQTDRR